eukprot:TRINITY_DN2989_c0_g2_i1.p2 TRINITY_DN2989_c0_g2~~TRINITY_DN2989_c0_g2_i1.p2  ORF type:complete len:149 (+),score=51.38 TRINITY_DN2989_c0_g2_i1:102-548(+)
MFDKIVTLSIFFVLIALCNNSAHQSTFVTAEEQPQQEEKEQTQETSSVGVEGEEQGVESIKAEKYDEKLEQEKREFEEKWQKEMEEAKVQWQQVAERMRAAREGNGASDPFGNLGRRGPGSKYSPRGFNSNLRENFSKLRKQKNSRTK